PLYEGLVDLQSADREGAQMRQRRITRSEIVELDLDAPRVEEVQRLAYDVGAFTEKHRFRDLDREVAVLEAHLVKPHQNALRQLAVGEVALANVQRHRHGIEAGAPPRGDIGRYRMQHATTETARQRAIGERRREDRRDDARADLTPDA